MRNSIQGPLLRTGHNSSFRALGETGYPVFKMAFQLREAIYRLDAGRDLARHLAIPQNDQGGDVTDWYSSFPGDVIPWSSASYTEQESALHQFNEFQAAVQSLSEQLLKTEQNGSGGDRKVFAQLLKSVTYFPDYEFVYLVNGVLVITFWGFVHPDGELRNPMHWLKPVSATLNSLNNTIPQIQKESTVARVVAPTVEPVVYRYTQEVEPIAYSRHGCWRWLRWLLLALLIILLLGLLRGCIPSLPLPGIPVLSTDKTTNMTVPSAVHSDVNNLRIKAQPSSLSDNTVSSPNVTGKVDDGTLNTVRPTVQTESISENASVKAPLPHSEMRSEGDEVVTKPVSPAARNSAARATPAVQPITEPAVIPTQGQPITLPASLPDGPARFLNGEWRVNGGIQDSLTGRPLQAQYNFNQGNGTVSIRQSSGITCHGPASGYVQKGALNITNPEQMTCSDGSSFIVPTIECKSPTAGNANCIGSNDGETTFPIRMLQPNS
ncbi:hypothetical protein FOC33_16785 [Plesiomonas shigelloides]|uniref:SrfA family protein n=1 Tax=Plesiomonas shigelloides TaxID=703 RepID=UPI000DFC7A29|nr:hypothetical protein FOC33_16785 [Plesiomonas shigelloides]SUC49133.1 Uncharacterised protein [Plesiomonas shigelloides]